MSKKDGGGGYVQTFDFASKTVTMEENDHFSEEEADNFIEFKADNKIPSIKIHDTEEDEGKPARGEWGNKYDFLFSCISVSVGLGNVWRFPYLCFENGGGSFLIVYFIAMIFCGMPIFFQEVAIGQYLGSGGMTLVSQLCPMLKGVGVATMTVVFFLDIYYCIIISWSFFYLISTFASFYHGELYWENCGHYWNTDLCFRAHANLTENKIELGMHKTEFDNYTHTNITKTPVEEFWDHRVLQVNGGIEHGLGALNWELVGCLVLSWIFVYGIIAKGLHSSGKIIWFTALFPYFVMFILLGRALTLDGAMDGLSYMFHIDPQKLIASKTWIDGASQIFFAYSVGMGALPALGSYNKFHHNCYRDALMTCVVNTMTCLLAGILVFCILGYMSKLQGQPLEAVVNSGPGLVFLTYPDLVVTLPVSGLWALIFFCMLLVLGIDSEFCNVEALVTGIVDNWPDKLLKHRRIFTVGICFVLFLLGIPMCTEGGIYLFKLMDFYSCSGMALIWVCFFQTIAIGWFFGAERFADCVEQMTGTRPGIFWRLCWKYFAPMVMGGVFIFFCYSFDAPTYGNNYTYPKWAEVFGIFLSMSSMLWIPGYAIYYLFTEPGTFRENLRRGLQSNMNLRKEAKLASKIHQNLKDGFGPNLKRLQIGKPGPIHISESGIQLLNRENSEFEMGNISSRDPSFTIQQE